MKPRLLSKTIGMAAGCLLLGFSGSKPLFASDGWAVSAGNGGTYSMTWQEPPTYLKIEKSISLTLDGRGVPNGGGVKYRDDIDRELTAGEVTYYWEGLNGEQAFWNYLDGLGKLASVNPQSSQIPAAWFGKTAKVVTTGNLVLFGRLTKSNDSREIFTLVVDGACCGPIQFETRAVSQIQEMK